MERWRLNLVITYMIAISFGVHFLAGFGVASLFGWPTLVRAGAGLGVAGVLFAFLWVLERITPLAKRQSSGGFIKISFRWQDLWMAPGFFVVCFVKRGVS